MPSASTFLSYVIGVAAVLAAWTVGAMVLAAWFFGKIEDDDDPGREAAADRLGVKPDQLTWSRERGWHVARWCDDCTDREACGYTVITGNELTCQALHRRGARQSLDAATRAALEGGA